MTPKFCNVFVNKKKRLAATGLGGLEGAFFAETYAFVKIWPPSGLGVSEQRVETARFPRVCKLAEHTVVESQKPGMIPKLVAFRHKCLVFCQSPGYKQSSLGLSIHSRDRDTVRDSPVS